MMDIFETCESGVRSYAASFPDVFERARGARVVARSGREYLDFFAGAGVLNYGHNHPVLKQALLDYLACDGILQALDMATTAKEALLQAVQQILLHPRGLAYRQFFPGPTGTNCIEAALKLARKATGRPHVIAFSNGFHGMTLGALAATGNPYYRVGAGVALNDVSFMPYDGEHGPEVDTLATLEQWLDDHRAELPAACLVEAIQGEGGCRVASDAWLRGLRRLCDRYRMLLIVDDIQAGCGRSGDFFSFESAAIQPDIVCLSKGISGLGLPLALLLVKDEFDVLAPGQHSGTFRGNNAAFVTARAALELYWRDDALAAAVKRHAAVVQARLRDCVQRWPAALTGARGRGLMQGLVFAQPEQARAMQAQAFRDGLMVETGGPRGEVLRIMCPLTISEAELAQGLDIIEHALSRVLA
jgi:diaminobutyrate-2-oxoglutarate transaminase